MGAGGIEVSVKLELWYLDFIMATSKNLAQSVDDGRLSAEKAMSLMNDVLFKTLEHGIVVE